MARNEEKQLARLNRLYLQQQKEEELKKRPPRPKLDSLHTADEIKKWLPSILRDIDFYVKQMEVACYPQRQIDEFSCRLDGLRGEYKAYVLRLRSLQPDLTTTPWTDRPYECKKARRDNTTLEHSSEPDAPNSRTSINNITDPQSKGSNFIPLTIPVLDKAKLYDNCFGYQKPTQPVHCNVNKEAQDRPLDFHFTTALPQPVGSMTHTELLGQDEPLDFKFATAPPHSQHKTDTLDNSTALDYQCVTTSPHSVSSITHTEILGKPQIVKVPFDSSRPAKNHVELSNQITAPGFQSATVPSHLKHNTEIQDQERALNILLATPLHTPSSETLRTERPNQKKTSERTIHGEKSDHSAVNSEIITSESRNVERTLALPYSDSSSSEDEDS